MSDRRWYETTSEEIYAYRTTKHGAVGLPVIGRHWAYVGRTARPDLRHREHMHGGGKWRAAPKPWADLEPRRYVLARKKRRTELTTKLLEWFWIRILLPVYNVSMNAANPRRVKPWEQKRQRLQRDRYGQQATVAVGTVVRTALVSTGVAFTLYLVHLGR